MTFTVGSLFTGIAGLDLGLEWAGGRIIWQSEIDPYACKVLAQHYPHVPNLGDVKAIDWSEVERPALICGGFPCQPVSKAGRWRRGEADERWLWPYFAAAIGALRPRYVLVENVANLLRQGFGRVLGDLAALGYDTEWDCIRASDAGAPHQRDRVFIVAYPQESGAGLDGLDAPGPGRGPAQGGGAGLRPPDRGASHLGAAPGCDRSPILSGAPYADWAPEPGLGRLADGVPARLDRLRCLGNAVVPQVAEWLGRRIIDSAGLPSGDLCPT